MSQQICFVAPFGMGVKGTVPARILPLAGQLARQGFRVTVLVPPWDTPGDAGTQCMRHGVRIVQVALQGGAPGVLGRLLAHVRREGPDLVHIVKPRAYAGLVQWVLWYWRRARRRSRPRILLDVDDWEQAWAPVAGYAPPMARFLAWQEEWGIRHADGVTAASHWLTDRVRQAKLRMPVYYLPNGIPEPLPELPPSADGPGQWDEAPTVLLFSRFIEVDSAWLAAMWSALQALVPGVRLVVAGAAVQASRAERVWGALTAATLPCRGGVEPLRWVGYVDPPDLAAYYRRVHCAIFPAADTILNRAKCSVRLATTLVHGVPVVASAVGEQACYGAAGAARLVPATASAQQFAAIVAEVLAAPTARSALAATARQRLLAAYRWSDLGEQLASFYGQFISEF